MHLSLLRRHQLRHIGIELSTTKIPKVITLEVTLLGMVTDIWTNTHDDDTGFLVVIALNVDALVQVLAPLFQFFAIHF